MEQRKDEDLEKRTEKETEGSLRKKKEKERGGNVSEIESRKYRKAERECDETET
jgi:hypothetical protein